jgi:hypothetical protein
MLAPFGTNRNAIRFGRAFFATDCARAVSGHIASSIGRETAVPMPRSTVRREIGMAFL